MPAQYLTSSPPAPRAEQRLGKIFLVFTATKTFGFDPAPEHRGGLDAHLLSPLPLRLQQPPSLQEPERWGVGLIPSLSPSWCPHRVRTAAILAPASPSLPGTMLMLRASSLGGVKHVMEQGFSPVSLAAAQEGSREGPQLVSQPRPGFTRRC